MDAQGQNVGLFQAAGSGDLQALLVSMESGAELMAIDPETGLRAISIAARAGHVACVAELAARASATSLGWTKAKSGAPAHEAADAGQGAALAALLRRGANPNAKDAHGRTALHVAAMGGSSDCVRLLLARCDAEEPDARGWTPLMLAARGEHVGAVVLLARRGQLWRALSKGEWMGLDALGIAKRAGSEECARHLELCAGQSVQSVGSLSKAGNRV
jgi:ankyrin repeat protein